jgi:hypothetical protein
MRRRDVLKAAGLGILGSACSSTLRSVSPVLDHQAPAVGAMLTGVNACFRAPVDPETAALIGSWGRTNVRASVNDASEVNPILDAFAAWPDVSFTLLIDTFDGAIVQQVAGIAQARGAFAIELFNETVYDNIDAATFGRAVGDLERWLRAFGYTGVVISGGIPNTQPAQLEYLRAAKAAGRWGDVVPGIHRYSTDGEPQAPSKGHASRAAEWQMIADVCGPRWALTECGYVYDGRPEETIANYVSIDFANAQRHGAIVANLYQINDGPGAEPIDRFGVRTFDGRVRPVADVLKAWGNR